MAEKTLLPNGIAYAYLAKAYLWVASLTAATSAYYTLKSTNLYRHYGLHRYDLEPLVQVTILLLHAILAFLMRGGGYILDLRGPLEPHWTVAALEAQFHMLGMLFVMQNQEFLNDAPMMMTAAAFSVFLMCFLRAVAPGFGWKLPIIPLVACVVSAYRMSRLLEMVPYVIAIFVANTHLLEYDIRHVPNPRLADCAAGPKTGERQRQSPKDDMAKSHETSPSRTNLMT